LALLPIFSESSTMKKFISVFLTIISFSFIFSSNPSHGFVGTLAGEKWVLDQYRDSSMANPLPRHDTLVFITDSTYTWNGVHAKYLYSGNDYQTSLELFDTPFGTVNGVVASTFDSYGEIIDSPFYQYYGAGQIFYFWMTKQP